MNDNIVDFTSRWLQREETKEELEQDELEDLHDICTIVSNDAINALADEYDLDIQQIEFSPEIIFFFEAFKGLILKCAGHWHPFQDMAKEFFDAYGITIQLKDDGNYHFVMRNTELETPAND